VSWERVIESVILNLRYRTVERPVRPRAVSGSARVRVLDHAGAVLEALEDNDFDNKT
jgi:hypothetical protein